MHTRSRPAAWSTIVDGYRSSCRHLEARYESPIQPLGRLYVPLMRIYRRIRTLTRPLVDSKLLSVRHANRSTAVDPVRTPRSYSANGELV